MPRHTRPPAKAKHPRGEVRYQRDRHIAKRFRALKANGRLDYYHLRGTRALGDETTEAELAAYLHARGENYPARWYFGEGEPHPDALANMPADLKRRVDNGVPHSGELCRGDLLPNNPHCGGCQCCRPRRLGRGYRTRVNRVYLDELAAGVEEHLDGERLDGQPVSLVERNLSRGWC